MASKKRQTKTYPQQLGDTMFFFSDPKVFISYHYENDRHYKNLIVAWSKNASFDISFYDKSVDVSVNSTKAGPIRRVISSKINDSDVFLCIVGKYTHKSSWVDWEIKKAHELKKSFVAVKIDRAYKTPKALYNKNAEWALSFKVDAIQKAINAAHSSF